MLPSSVGIFDANISEREKKSPRRTRPLPNIGGVWQTRSSSVFSTGAMVSQQMTRGFHCLFGLLFFVKMFIFWSIWEFPHIRNDFSDYNFSALLHLSVDIRTHLWYLCWTPQHQRSPPEFHITVARSALWEVEKRPKRSFTSVLVRFIQADVFLLISWPVESFLAPRVEPD